MRLGAHAETVLELLYLRLNLGPKPLADHPAGEKIEGDSQIGPALVRPHGRDMGRPSLVRFLGRELLRKKVASDQEGYGGRRSCA